MYLVDLYLTVRLACHVEELSQREAARRFGLSRDTVKKMLRHSVPPGYRRSEPPKRPKLDPFTDIIDRILEADRTVHRKQRHTAKRIFERLRDEHGFTGGQTIVKDYVRERRRRLPDGRRQRTRSFSELQSHYLCEDRYGRPGTQAPPTRLRFAHAKRYAKPRGSLLCTTGTTRNNAFGIT